MNRKKFLFYGRLWGITVGGALVAGLILALITWLNRGGDVRRMIWYMLAVDCMMTGYFCLQILPFFFFFSTVPLMIQPADTRLLRTSLPGLYFAGGRSSTLE